MEKILAFHLNDSELYKLKQAAALLKIRVSVIDPADCRQKLCHLISGKKDPSAEPFSGELPQGSLLLLCDFTDARLDKLLLTLRKKSVTVDYKAILTPTNREWNVLRLMLEMKAEKDAIAQK